MVPATVAGGFAVVVVEKALRIVRLRLRVGEELSAMTREGAFAAALFEAPRTPGNAFALDGRLS